MRYEVYFIPHFFLRERDRNTFLVKVFYIKKCITYSLDYICSVNPVGNDER